MKSLFSKLILSACLLAPLSHEVYASGAKAPSNPPVNPGTPPVTPPSDGEKFLDFALNLAIIYAKNEPRYAVLLNTLGINNSADLKNFLLGNANGTNFRNIAAHLIFQKAGKDPKVRAVLTQLGISDLQSLRNYLSTQGGSAGNQALLEIALQYAIGNSKYAIWLNRLNIKSVADFQKLLQGSGTGGNLQSLLVIVALNYVESNPKYSQYVPYIQAAMAMLGLTSGSDGSGDPRTPDDDIIDLGPFAGMTVGETKAVRGIR